MDFLDGIGALTPVPAGGAALLGRWDRHLKLTQNPEHGPNRATKPMQMYDATPDRVSALFAAIAGSVGRGGFVTRPFCGDATKGGFETRPYEPIVLRIRYARGF